jgi:hypothetical protein
MVPCLKVSLIVAVNKGEMACSGSKSHDPVHLVREPPQARVVEIRFPFLPLHGMRPVRGKGLLPEPEALKWPLDHGANPNCTKPGRKYPDSALDFVIGSFSRSEQLAACIEILTEAGCESRTNMPAVLDLPRGQLDLLGARLDEGPSPGRPMQEGRRPVASR